jgi:GTP:adenosylcobinamide-phosphate guanylyltransferase
MYNRQGFLVRMAKGRRYFTDKSDGLMHKYGKLNAIILAGDRGKSHPVFGKNKAFLDVCGVPLITRVVTAVDGAESVAEIYVVGPRDRLEEALSPERYSPPVGKPVHIFEQRANLYENAWYTFLETIPAYRRGESIESIEKGPDADGIAVILAADMPLLTSAEVDEFVSKCNMERFDYVVGVTLEDNLKQYYPAGDKPGIHLAYLHFREGNLRQNNMQMIRPFKILNRHYVQIMYDLRYQKEFGNIVRLAWEILRKEEGGWGAVGNYLLLQLSLLFSRLGLNALRNVVRNRTYIDSVEMCVSKLLKTRFSVAFTSLGGATLDIDSEQDYAVIEQRFFEWMDYQQQRAFELSTRVSSE